MQKQTTPNFTWCDNKQLLFFQEINEEKIQNKIK